MENNLTHLSGTNPAYLAKIFLKFLAAYVRVPQAHETDPQLLKSIAFMREEAERKLDVVKLEVNRRIAHERAFEAAPAGSADALMYDILRELNVEEGKMNYTSAMYTAYLKIVTDSIAAQALTITFDNLDVIVYDEEQAELRRIFNA